MRSYSAKFKDIVCGMNINTDNIAVDYQGIHYAFCSNQCLDRFQLNPHLYIGYPGSEAPKHAGIEVLKRRKLKLAEPLPQDVTEQVIECIQAMMGIHDVKIEDDCISIVYDLLQATESQIEQAIGDSGIVLGNDIKEKIRRAFVHYLEETEVESLEARPASKGGHHH